MDAAAEFRKKKITRNLTFIKYHISADLDTFVDGLIEKDILDIDFKEKFKFAPTAKERSDILICTILKKGPGACDVFIDLLKKNNYKDVLKKLDEVETKVLGASRKTGGQNRDQASNAEGFKEEQGACEGKLVFENCPRPTSSPELEVMERSLVEVYQSNYKQLQTAYTGLREQLNEKRNQLFTLNQQYVAAQKELEESKSLKDAKIKLENENVRLKAKINDLKGRLANKEEEISNISTKMKELEIKLREEKESRERLEKTVNEQKEKLDEQSAKLDKQSDKLDKQSDKLDKQSKLLTTMSQAIQNIETMFDKNQHQTRTKSTQDHEQRQPFMQGTKTKPNNSHNRHLNKTKGSGKNK